MSLDTISNYSRPSRVKRHQDTESEHSYHSGVSSNNSYTHQSNVSASQIFAQQYVPYPGYPPMVPMMPHMGVANPMKQHSGSSISSRDGIQPGIPQVTVTAPLHISTICPSPLSGYPMPPYGPYGMYPPPMPGYGYYPGGGQYPPYPQVSYLSYSNRTCVLMSWWLPCTHSWDTSTRGPRRRGCTWQSYRGVQSCTGGVVTPCLGGGDITIGTRSVFLCVVDDVFAVLQMLCCTSAEW